MYKYIFNTKGEYVAYIYNEKYCFSKNNNYIGFIDKAKLYDYEGYFIGELTGDDRIVRNIFNVYENIEPIDVPRKVKAPIEPKARMKMPRLPRSYIDIFENNKRSKNEIYINNLLYNVKVDDVIAAIQFNPLLVRRNIRRQRKEIESEISQKLKVTEV